MDTLANFRIRAIAEADVIALIEAAGGKRAHPDADQRLAKGADFLLGTTLIELKGLEEDGLEKPARQQKLAALFTAHQPNRPVIVLDPGQLPETEQRWFDRIMEGPIKTAVTSARRQLKQSRAEFEDARCSVLFVINNGYTALNHDNLARLLAHRVRQDTSEIDGVVVAGCYFHSDGVDSYFLWPIDYIPINLDRPFAEYEQLRIAWQGCADTFMSTMMTGELGPDAAKGPVVDAQFESDGITFVKPAPPIGGESSFFPYGRKRKNSTGLTSCPPVALTFPALSRAEWSRFKQALPNEPELRDSYEAWCAHLTYAAESGQPLKPFVPMSVSWDGWEIWLCETGGSRRSMRSVRDFAAHLFNEQVQRVLRSVREQTPSMVLPPRYVLALTEEIGQDMANDISHIARIEEGLGESRTIVPILEDIRIFHEYAAALAAAYAVRERIDHVLWRKDRRYAWY